MTNARKAVQSEPLFGVASSAMGREWLLNAGPERTVRALVQQYNLDEPVARIMAARGFDKESAQAFLNPSLRDQMPDPLVFKDMDKAIHRAVKAITQGEQIVIFGDYDVDGATSSALLRLYLRGIGVNSTVYIPDRLKEGYGPNEPAMRQLAAEGNKLCFTVDCGTTAFKPIAAANEAGMDVVVLDHHAPEAQLPAAVALVNPVRMDESDEGRRHNNLAAVGVTYMFVVGLNRALRQAGYFANRSEPDLLDFLDIVALGTVADVVLLTGLNRVLVSKGLEVMAMRKRVGMNALMDVSGLAERPEAWHLGFYLGPRINAGGRVGRSDMGVNLLTSENKAVAEQIAFELNNLNHERQTIEQLILEQSIPEAERQASCAYPMIMVHHQDWHPGVVGIVASRLKERFNRPSLVIGYNPYSQTYVGSGRSVKGVNLGESVIAARQQGLLDKGGGHKMAAGVGLRLEQLEPFRAFMHERVGHELSRIDTKPTLHIDAVVSAGAVTPDFIERMKVLAPYGNGNPEPRLVLHNVRLTFARLTGNGSHIMCQFTGADGKSVEGIAFRAADQPHGVALLNGMGQMFHVAGTADINNFNGRTRAQFKVDDVAPAI